MTSNVQTEQTPVGLVVSALNEKLGPEGIKCPLCHENQWEVEDYFASVSAGLPPHFPPTPYQPRGRFFPFAVLSCMNCGYSFFVNLARLGLAEELGLGTAE